MTGNNYKVKDLPAPKLSEKYEAKHRVTYSLHFKTGVDRNLECLVMGTGKTAHSFTSEQIAYSNYAEILDGHYFVTFPRGPYASSSTHVKETVGKNQRRIMPLSQSAEVEKRMIEMAEIWYEDERQKGSLALTYYSLQDR